MDIDISKVRKRIWQLDTDRRKLQHHLVNPRDMVIGSVYSLYKRCGNPVCKRCKKGQKHGPFKVISYTEAGMTRQVFIRKADRIKVISQAANYKNYQRKLLHLRRINNQIVELIKTIRDAKAYKYR